MRAGLLTEVVNILRATLTRNNMGEEVEEWGTIYTTRARVENVSSQLTQENSEALYNFQKRFTLRIYVPIMEFDRIELGGKLYRVLSLDKNKTQMEIVVIGELIND